MFAKRFFVSTFFPIIIPFAILILAHSVDYLYYLVGQESASALTMFPYWYELIGLNALFALGIVLFLWYLLGVPRAQPVVSIMSLILFLFIFLYRYFVPHESTYGLPLYFSMLHSRLLMNSSPRSFLVITAIILAISAFISLIRFFVYKKSPKEGT